MAASQSPVAAAPAVEDDLEGLVGRWRCVTRQYLRKGQSDMLSSDAEDSLDYLNVYFPYADDRLTLKLPEYPTRPIAAEFLVRYIYSTDTFKEVLAPMSPRVLENELVRIGRRGIRYSTLPSESIYFKYRLEHRGVHLWLVLESNSMRLELLKLPQKLGDVKDSHVYASIKDYSPERIAELKKQYEELKKRSQSAAPDHPDAKSP